MVIESLKKLTRNAESISMTIISGYMLCNGQEVSIRPYSYSDCGYSDYIISKLSR